MDILVEINPLKGATHPLLGVNDWNSSYIPMHPALRELTYFRRAKDNKITSLRNHSLKILNILETSFPYCSDFKIKHKIDENGNWYYDLIGVIETKTDISLFSWQWLREHRESNCYKMASGEVQTAIKEMEWLINNVQIQDEHLIDLKLKIEIFKTIYFIKTESHL